MPSKQLHVISHCEKSPWFSRTWSENAFYSEYAGRLVLLSLGNDTLEEYWSLRRSVGLFDVPERPVEIKGKDALGFLNRVFTRPLDKLRIGRGSYGLLCHRGGGMVCDGILFKLAEDHYWYVHADADVYLWLEALAVEYEVQIRDPGSWVLQVQGPKSLDVLAKACDREAAQEFRYFDAFQGRMGGQKVLVSRTGWSAELGFEVYNLDADVDGPALWDHLIAAGAEFGMAGCSQLAMNIRRIEGGILNYRTDMDWHTTPYDMGLGQFVDLEGHDFIGRDALCNAVKEPRFSGFKCEGRPLRYGSAVISAGNSVGRVTAYEVSPYLECGVGFVLLDSADGMSATGLSIVDSSGNDCPIELVDLPFYDAEKNIPRGLPSDADITG
ncbi:MAG: aminomethyl transferase family protein [Gammaproteobacteria bacterium]|nr:aminomethyl transferase family protein [Gammaproteobacteria bacterium]